MQVREPLRELCRHLDACGHISGRASSIDDILAYSFPESHALETERPNRPISRLEPMADDQAGMRSGQLVHRVLGEHFICHVLDFNRRFRGKRRLPFVPQSGLPQDRRCAWPNAVQPLLLTECWYVCIEFDLVHEAVVLVESRS